MTAALSAVFWGVVVLSLLVFVHEGGHFLAARAFGMRVTEFFLGMPCPARLSRTSRRYGTEYGVTPVLLGGYTKVCGMEGGSDELLAPALACVMGHGRIEVAALADEVGCSVDKAYELLVTLADWASVQPYYDPEKGERPSQRDYPESFETVRRDGNLLTAYDPEHDFSAPGTTEEGDARPLGMDAAEFLERERSHTYAGQGFWHRVVMLVAGPLVNVVCGVLLVVCVLSVSGVTVAVDSPTVGGVTDGSLAQQAGMVAGDTVVAVNDVSVSTWTELVAALDPVLSAGGDFDVTYSHDGTEVTSHVAQDAGDASSLFGISASTMRVHLGVGAAFASALEYTTQVATYAAKLVMPSHTMEVLDDSSSVVGISVMASQAAEQGPDELALLAAAISMSLAIMNLLPIPPLDGGKVLIETIGAIRRRPVPSRVQTGISYVGLALFMALFVYVLRQDIMRLVIG